MVAWGINWAAKWAAAGAMARVDDVYASEVVIGPMCRAGTHFRSQSQVGARVQLRTSDLHG